MSFKNDFRPDICIGNPPYNNGIDIEFVINACKVCRIAVSMITPAKWQTAEGNQRINSKYSYKDFRENIVKHIDKVVLYPQSIDVFDVHLIDGISWYIVDKNNTFEKALVKNICTVNKNLNTKEIRPIINAETLINIGYDIIKSLGNYNRFKFNANYNGKYQVWVNSQYSSSGARAYLNDGTTVVIGVCRIIEEYETNESSTSACVFASDNIEECKNFIYWINSSIVRFMIAMNISKLGPILTDHYFRFVPEPPVDEEGRHYTDQKYTGWKKRYTDDELYKYYKVDKIHQEIINSIIKKRDSIIESHIS